MTRPDDQWVAPRHAAFSRRMLLTLIVPLALFLLLGILLRWLSEAHQMDCIDSIYWCTDQQFYLQVASRTAYGIGLLLGGLYCVLSSWRVWRRNAWPPLSAYQHGRLRHRRHGVDGAGAVPVLRGRRTRLIAAGLALLATGMIGAAAFYYFRPLRLLLF